MQHLIMVAGAALMMVAGSASASPQGRLAKCESACESVHPARSAVYDSCIADCQVSSHREAEQGASVDPGRIENDTQMAEGGIGSDGTTYGEDGSVVGYSDSCVYSCNYHTTESGYKGCMASCRANKSDRAAAQPTTQIATSDYHQCQINCSNENPSEDAYNSCISGCAADNQASTEPPTMIAYTPYHGVGCQMQCSGEPNYPAMKACMEDCKNNIHQGAVDPSIENDNDVLDAFRDGSRMRTLIAHTAPMSIDGAPAACGVDAYGCLLERNDTMSGADLSDAWQTAGAVCINFIFTPNYCCEIKDGVQRCWVE